MSDPKISAPAASRSEAPDTDGTSGHDAPSELLAPAIGLLVVIVAVSSLLDDSGLVDHPWWVSFAIGVTVAATALAGRTIAKLAHTTDR